MTPPVGDARRYVTTPDRAALARAAGGALAGLLVVATIVAAGPRAAWASDGAWLIGSLFAVLAIVAVAGPAWIALHATGRRGPLAAATTGATAGLIVVVVAQRWNSVGALGTAATLVLAAGGIGWTMQRVAYRLDRQA